MVAQHLNTINATELHTLKCLIVYYGIVPQKKNAIRLPYPECHFGLNQ